MRFDCVCLWFSHGAEILRVKHSFFANRLGSDIRITESRLRMRGFQVTSYFQPSPRSLSYDSNSCFVPLWLWHFEFSLVTQQSSSKVCRPNPDVHCRHSYPLSAFLVLLVIPKLRAIGSRQSDPYPASSFSVFYGAARSLESDFDTGVVSPVERGARFTAQSANPLPAIEGGNRRSIFDNPNIK